MKKIIIIITMICMLTGCGALEKTEPERSNNIRIGIMVYDQYDTFISNLLDSAVEEAKAIEKRTGDMITLDIVNAAGSQIEQNNQMEDLLSKGCNVICVNLVDRTNPSVIIDKAKSADVPIVFFNRELVEEDLDRWEKLYYVGAVAFESGTMEGNLLASAFLRDSEMDKNGDGILQYVMLEGEAGHQDAIIRTEYSIQAITDRGVKVEKLAYSIANWNRAQAQSKMAQWIDTYGEEIEAVISNNDDMALGAIDALHAKGIAVDDFPAIVGIDGTPIGVEAVLNGEMVGTVYNDRIGQAKAMMRLAYSLATDIRLPENIVMEDDKYIRLPHAMITQRNAQEYQD